MILEEENEEQVIKINIIIGDLNKIIDKLFTLDYGFYDIVKRKKIAKENPLFFDSEYINKNCRLSSPNLLLRRKIGCCFDFTLFIFNYIKAKYPFLNTKILFFQKYKPIEFHTTVAFSDKKNWYWVEGSYLKFKGIHIFNHISNLGNFLINEGFNNWNIVDDRIAKSLLSYSKTNSMTIPYFIYHVSNGKAS